jgi:hypothetical protein
MRISRIWRDLLTRKRSGYGHDEEEPGDGDLGLFCPACPQPGINIPPDWKERPDQYVSALIHARLILIRNCVKVALSSEHCC